MENLWAPLLKKFRFLLFGKLVLHDVIQEKMEENNSGRGRDKNWPWIRTTYTRIALYNNLQTTDVLEPKIKLQQHCPTKLVLKFCMCRRNWLIKVGPIEIGKLRLWETNLRHGFLLQNVLSLTNVFNSYLVSKVINKYLFYNREMLIFLHRHDKSWSMV